MIHSQELLEARQNLFQGLADSTRLEILELLAEEGAKNASELRRRFPKV